jgi:hypothetical protein
MMSLRTRLIVAAVFSGGLFGGWASAQTFKAPQPLDSPVVLSGPDVGFRVEGKRGTAAVGRLMVRIDGQWREAEFATGPAKLMTQ